MFWNSWNKRILAAVFLLIMQAVIYTVILGRDNVKFTIISFIVASLPGFIGVFLIWLEKQKGRY